MQLAARKYEAAEKNGERKQEKRTEAHSAEKGTIYACVRDFFLGALQVSPLCRELLADRLTLTGMNHV